LVITGESRGLIISLLWFIIIIIIFIILVSVCFLGMKGIVSTEEWGSIAKQGASSACISKEASALNTCLRKK
jgi:hypothetical protein